MQYEELRKRLTTEEIAALLSKQPTEAMQRLCFEVDQLRSQPNPLFRHLLYWYIKAKPHGGLQPSTTMVTEALDELMQERTIKAHITLNSDKNEGVYFIWLELFQVWNNEYFKKVFTVLDRLKTESMLVLLAHPSLKDISSTYSN